MGIKLGDIAISDLKVGDTQVGKVYLGEEVVWQKAAVKALKFTLLDSLDSTATLSLEPFLGNYSHAHSFEYSYDGSLWSTLTIGTKYPYVNGVIYVRGYNPTYGVCEYTGTAPLNNPSKCVRFASEGTSKYKVSGNLMDLVDYNTTPTTIPSGSSFSCLFNGSTHIYDASELVFGAENITNGAYHYMFTGCSNMAYGPQTINPTIMTPCACAWAFSRCSAMETPPTLPCTTLGQNCYFGMFDQSGITSAPDLLAANLVSSCYANMFTLTTKLHSIRCLAISNISAGTNRWFENAPSTGTFIKKAGTSWSRGVSGIPTGWTVVEE